MKTPGLNLFILDDNKPAAEELKEHLLKRYGNSINVEIFSDKESCLKEVDTNTHIVVLNDMLNGQHSIEILKAIKGINPKTEVIMLSERESIPLIIESVREGHKVWVVKGPGSKRKVGTLINHIFTFPLKIIQKELGLPQRLAIFIMSFLTITIVVLLYYYLFINKT